MDQTIYKDIIRDIKLHFGGKLAEALRAGAPREGIGVNTYTVVFGQEYIGATMNLPDDKVLMCRVHARRYLSGRELAVISTVLNEWVDEEYWKFGKRKMRHFERGTFDVRPGTAYLDEIRGIDDVTYAKMYNRVAHVLGEDMFPGIKATPHEEKLTCDMKPEEIKAEASRLMRENAERN